MTDFTQRRHVDRLANGVHHSLSNPPIHALVLGHTLSGLAHINDNVRLKVQAFTSVASKH